ncbi:uncharacterized protein LOC131293368 [Anopheles ziemanni]|uniref:uncharacterized protein LOC131263435 n=1 Tax=Anopheles coustani TaxID=139045 RepID=UPI00265A18C5|nr:uncharacterized protein LOC131263435 [Anopheles coustani]XP_058177430.1 uncharacterized protein LOC131293368 [Anopheles ziemanni]
MLRLTHVVVLVALASVVLAGPTVRKDEVTNVVTVAEVETTKPVAVESPTVPTDQKLVTVPVKLLMAADEQLSESTTVKASSEVEPSTTTSTEPSTTTTEVTTSSVASTSVASTSGASAAASPVTKPPRKTITFDQRQEGKYNIRADLENFVIVVVPSGSSSGASLLDLLTRSAQKKDAYHHHHHHHETRKSNGKRKNNKAQYAGAPKKKASQGLVTPEVIVLDESNQRSGQLVAEEFIEGRTPYKVDLSSSARSVDEAGHDSEPHQQQQQSFRFSVEPSEARSSGRVRFPSVTSGNYARSSSDVTSGRALRGTADEPEFANTNTLVVAASSATNHYHQQPNPTNLPGDGAQHRQLPTVLLAELPSILLPLRPAPRNANGAREDTEPPTHGNRAPHRTSTGDEGSAQGLANHSHLPSSFDSLEYAPLRPDVDMKQLQLQPDEGDGSNDNGTVGGDPYEDLAEQRQRPDGDGWDELRLLGAQEQCGPDRKRDSYGVCQFVRP